MKVYEIFLRSPQKFTSRASPEIDIRQQSVWRALRQRLVLPPYKLHMVQALRASDRAKCLETLFYGI